MTSIPKISVIMSVYNGEKYLKEAVESILNQTYSDFEFIIVNDGSTDNTEEILKQFDDPRIKIVKNSENLGLTKSLNKAINIATGKYIARMDADDISLLTRLEKEVYFLDNHPKVTVVGTFSYWIDDDGRIIGRSDFPSFHADIQRDLLFRNPLCHGSVMFRKDALQEFGFYDEEFKHAQDYDLWLRVSEKYELANIPEYLFYWRYGEQSISKKRKGEQDRFADIARKTAIERRKKYYFMRCTPHADSLKILLVVHNFPTYCLSGTELYTYNFAQGLRQHGFDVRVLYPTYDTARPVGAVYEYAYEGLSVTSMNIHPPQNLVQMFMNEQVEGAFRNYLSGLDVDLVHFHHFIGFSASPLQVCSQMGIPAVVTLHDEWMLCEQYFYLHFDGSYCYKGPETVEKCVQCFLSRHSETNLMQYIQEIHHAFAFRRQYLKNALNWIDTLILPSEFLQKELKKHGFYHPKTLLIPLGLYTFNPLPWKPQKGLIRFSYVGNINFVKGLDLVIHALNMLNTDNFQLNIYGNVQHPAYFKQVMNTSFKKEVVKYHGPYKPEDLPGIFSQTDIAIVPSRSENYPFIVRECFHAGVPVIASNVGGIPEIVKDKVNGLLFRQGDFRDLTRKLQLVIKKPNLISTFRKHIKPVRTVSEDAEELEGIYRRIVEIKK